MSLNGKRIKFKHKYTKDGKDYCQYIRDVEDREHQLNLIEQYHIIRQIGDSCLLVGYGNNYQAIVVKKKDVEIIEREE